jgi:hypothetical protein
MHRVLVMGYDPCSIECVGRHRVQSFTFRMMSSTYLNSFLSVVAGRSPESYGGSGRGEAGRRALAAPASRPRATRWGAQWSARLPLNVRIGF